MTPELNCLIPVDRIGAQGLDVVVEASAAERAALARGDDHLADFRHARSRVVVKRPVIGGKLVDGVDDDGVRGATLSGVGRGE